MDFVSDIPPDLETKALRQFDTLLSKGDLLYEPPRTSVRWAQGFQFHFDVTPALSKKPILSGDDPGRSEPIGPFVNPPEEWILARIGQSHKLILNKYCVYRPMLILHTSLFVPQTEDLNLDDLTAAWAILRQIETPQIIIYNCGVEAGSSQGHKHIQIFPRVDSERFQMFPSKAKSETDVETNISQVPFMHFVVRLCENSSSNQVYTQYQRLLEMTKDALEAAGAGTDYNLILVSEWIALIPRRKKGWGPFIANAANMVGSLWLRSEAQRDEMLEYPLLEMLAGLGIPL